MILPPKMLRAKPVRVLIQSLWPTDVNGYENYPFEWKVDIDVTAQSHSSTQTRESYFYNGLDIQVGDWYSNTLNGMAWKVTAIESATTTRVTLILQDVDQYNTQIDPSGQGDGAPPTNIDGFVFSNNVHDQPILAGVIANVLTGQWQTDIMSRFRQTSPIVIPEIPEPQVPEPVVIPPDILNCYYLGKPDADQTMMFIAVASPQIYEFMVDNKSLARCRVEPTAEAVLEVLHNDDVIGTITFSPGSKLGVFDFTADADLKVGDTFQIKYQSTPDTTLEDISISLVGK